MLYRITYKLCLPMHLIHTSQAPSYLTESLQCHMQGRSQEFDLGGYKWVKETKQPHKTFKVD